MRPTHKIRKFRFDDSLDIHTTSITVEGNNRTIRTIWSPELTQDLQAYHGIDVESELTRLLSEEIARDIDRQIIQDLVRVQPLDGPTDQLFYFDFQYGISEPTVYGDGSWSLENLYESIIGIRSEIRKFQFV